MAEFPPVSADGRLAGLRPGTLVGGYRLEERIGSGAMAVVFRARDEALGRSVALKVLAGELAMDAEFRERFIRESRVASLVDHPNIIPVYGAGENVGALYLAMRHVSGGDLHSVVAREGPLPAGRAMSLLAPVASALDAAHTAGIVHRDVKPANVLVDVSLGRPDHPYLSDFGLAKRDMMASGLTLAGDFVGTPGFASPEQISGRPAGAPADQYALACVAFTMLTAQLPFRYRHPDAVLWAQMSQPPPRATPQRPDLAEAVDEVLARALAKDPFDRFPSCGDFADALGQALSAEPAKVRPSFPPEPAGDRRRVSGHLILGILAGEGAQPYTHAMLSELRNTHPEITVELRSLDFGSQFEDVASGTVDAAVIEQPVPSGLETLDLLTHPRVVLLASDDPLARSGRPLTLADLRDYTYIDMPPGTSRSWWDNWCMNPRPDGTSVRFGPVAHDIEAVMHAVARGEAIIFLPAAARDIYPRPGISYVDVIDLPPGTSTLAWTPKDRSLPAIAALREAARTVTRGQH